MAQAVSAPSSLVLPTVMPMATFQVKLFFFFAVVHLRRLLNDTNVVSTMLNVILRSTTTIKTTWNVSYVCFCLGSVAGLGAASLTSEADVRLKQLVLRFLCAKLITLTIRLVNKVSVPILHLDKTNHILH